MIGRGPNFDYKYGIFAKIGKKYSPSAQYWTNKQIKMWMDKNGISYENWDKREHLVERIKEAGYK